MIEFRVVGIPKPGGSKRAFVNKHTGRANIVDACKKNKQWRDSVASAAINADGYEGSPLFGPLELSVIFVMPRPKNHYRTGKFAGVLKLNAPDWHTNMPDRTKLLR